MSIYLLIIRESIVMFVKKFPMIAGRRQQAHRWRMVTSRHTRPAPPHLSRFCFCRLRKEKERQSSWLQISVTLRYVTLPTNHIRARKHDSCSTYKKSHHISSIHVVHTTSIEISNMPTLLLLDLHLLFQSIVYPPYFVRRIVWREHAVY